MGQLARQSLQTSALLALRVATQTAMLVLLTRLLPPTIYGNLTAAMALAVVMGLLPSLGSGYVMLSATARNGDATSDIWRYAWPLTLLLGCALLLVYLLCGGLITDRGLLSLKTLWWIGATELLVTPFITLLSFTLQACERVPLSQFVQWLPLGMRLLATAPCFAVDEQYRLATYATLQFATSVISLAISYRLTRRYVRLHWDPRIATTDELKAGASYAAMQLVAANPTELDKAIAVRAVGAHDAGIYAATSRIMGAMVTPVIALLLSAQPRLFRHAHRPDRQGKKLIGLIALLAFGWGIFSSVALAVCSPLLPVILGPTYAGTARLLPWVAITAPFLALRLSAGTVLVALGHPRERIAFEIAGVLLLASGMVVLPHYLGVGGLVAAVIMAEAVMAASGWWLVRKHNV